MDAIEILGFSAALFTTIANVPQAIKTIRTRSTKGISAVTYGCLTLGLSLWVIYGAFKQDFPIILSNSIASLLCCIILTIKLLNLKSNNWNAEEKG